MKVRRALTVQNVLDFTSTKIEFTGKFYDVFGHPQNKGRWIVVGNSGSGKSSFMMQLAKEFAKTEKVLYNFLEEDLDDDNVQDRLRLFRMHDVTNNFSMVSERIDLLTERLKKRNSAQVVIIDSAIYFFRGHPFEKFLEFTRQFPKKLFVFTAHGKGTQPRTEFETSIYYDATQKIFINGFLATNKGRKYGPNGKFFIIWQRGYEDLQGKYRSEEI
ncbi:hypothetical protein QP519_11095 [Weeksella virosa]|uniref:hypothetical protein n=1 Tax=Weeksella virosa TaxID=1014 RepID=UPI002556546A|nr:hypothetical protein [Weeksella virosa]MDK7376077.1 hypothetical protein [Weeksella virosa]MDK7674358.1 hypothetical protein [Weeksella virosa]